MKIYIGADHNGFHLREGLITYLKKAGYEVADEGDTQLDPNDDFPVFAHRVVSHVLSSDDPDARGILLCGSGQGMCMAANRFKGIRSALLYDNESARSSRNDDDSNIACLPAKVLQNKEAFAIIDTWLRTPFAKAPRFIRRLKAIDELN
jgi:ribose 5-phosphate isomerase B